MGGEERKEEEEEEGGSRTLPSSGEGERRGGGGKNSRWSAIPSALDPGGIYITWTCTQVIATDTRGRLVSPPSPYAVGCKLVLKNLEVN